MTSPVEKKVKGILPMGIDDSQLVSLSGGVGVGCSLQDRAGKGKRSYPSGQDLAGHIRGVWFHNECSENPMACRASYRGKNARIRRLGLCTQVNISRSQVVLRKPCLPRLSLLICKRVTEIDSRLQLEGI